MLKIETAQVIHQFLGGARCAEYRALLGPVYADPDFSNASQNQLRAAALASAKPAIAWLGLVGTRARGDEGFYFDSSLDWSIEPLTAARLTSGLGIMGKPIIDQVKKFRASGLDNSNAERWSKTCIDDGLKTWVNHPPSYNYSDGTTAPLLGVTIWKRNPDGTHMCIDGNHRIHRLAFEYDSGNTSCVNGWRIWVGQERAAFGSRIGSMALIQV